jgi:hypothetical protein
MNIKQMLIEAGASESLIMKAENNQILSIPDLVKVASALKGAGEIESFFLTGLPGSGKDFVADKIMAAGVPMANLDWAGFSTDSKKWHIDWDFLYYNYPDHGFFGISDNLRAHAEKAKHVFVVLPDVKVFQHANKLRAMDKDFPKKWSDTFKHRSGWSQKKIFDFTTSRFINIFGDDVDYVYNPSSGTVKDPWHRPKVTITEKKPFNK